jgi:hypothetical protein
MSCGIKCNNKRSMDTAHNTEDKREKIQALSLAKECYSMKLELLTNATVVDDAIRFVSQKSKDKENLKAHFSDNVEYDKESNESDYNEDKDQQEKEQEGQIGEITTN